MRPENAAQGDALRERAAPREVEGLLFGRGRAIATLFALALGFATGAAEAGEPRRGIERAVGASVPSATQAAEPSARPGPPTIRRLGVVDERGEPIEGARVVVWDAAGRRALQRAESDAEGGVALTAKRANRALLLVAAPGFLPRVLEAESLEMDDDAPREVALARGAARRVAPRDASSGAPLEGARYVIVSRFHEDPRLVSEATFVRRLALVEGERFGIVEGLPDEGATLVAFAEGRAPAFVNDLRPDLAAPARDVLLDDLSCVEAHVVEAGSQRPLAGARVAFSPVLLSAPLESAGFWETSGADGRVVFCPPSAGRARFVVAHQDFAARELDELPLEGESVALERAARVEGRLYAKSGVPLEGARVAARGGPLPIETRSRRGGEFTLHGLTPGRVVVDVEAPQGLEAARSRYALRLAPGETRRLDDAAPGARRRLLLGLGGAPLEGARALLLEEGELGAEPTSLAASTSDAAGLVELEVGDAREGALSLALRVDGALVVARLPAPEEGADPEEPRALEVAAELLRGRVLSSEDERELAGALVRCGPVSGAMRRGQEPGFFHFPELDASIVTSSSSAMAATDARGAFALPRPSWCRSLLVEGPRTEAGELPFASLELPLAPPPAADEELTLRLERGAGLRVVLERPAFARSARVTLSLHRPGERHAWFSEQTLEEAMVVETPDAGPWLVVARAAGLAPALSGAFELAPGEARRASLRLEAGAFLALESGNPLRLEDLRVFDERGLDLAPYVEALEHERGLSLGPIPLGRYRVLGAGVDERVRLTREGQSVTLSVGEEVAGSGGL